MSRDPIHIDIDPDPVLIPDESGKYSEYQWAFRTNEKNPKITVFKKQGETSTELGWSIVPLNNERTLWVLPTHYWDYIASEYDLYYESDTCERYLIEAFLKSEDFDKPFNGEQITYNNVTYNLVVDRYHDYISNIIYPDNTQYNIMDNNAVHLTGDETITGVKTFINSMTTGNIIPEGDITLGTSTNTWGKQLQFRDTTGKRIARIQPKAIDTTNNRVGMWVNNADNTVEKGIYVDSNGTTSAPTPTDTTTTTGTQIATTGWVNSTDNNVVHKTGYETIGGEKNFTSNLARINTNFTKGTNPSTTYYNAVEFTDKNGIGNINRVGMLETSIAANGLISTYITAYKYANNSTNNARIAVIYPTSGNPYTEAPASDVNGSIVTTVNKSKATNGYFKLGNGLIIQWGSSNVGTNTATTINLPTPFTSTNYKVVSGISTNSEGDRTQNWIRITDMTTTTFKLTKRDSSTLHWIAVGY